MNTISLQATLENSLPSVSTATHYHYMGSLSQSQAANHHNFLGHHGENWLATRLAESGYIVKNTALEAFCGDLRTLDTLTGEYLKIEAKTALQSPKGYGFCLRKHKKTDCSYSDFVALICIDNYQSHYLYLIEPSLFQNAQFMRIASHPTKYAGKYSPFLVRGNIDFNIVRENHELWSVPK